MFTLLSLPYMGCLWLYYSGCADICIFSAVEHLMRFFEKFKYMWKRYLTALILMMNIGKKFRIIMPAAKGAIYGGTFLCEKR